MPTAANALSIPDLAGKAVLVTGASTGIGAALVEAYAAAEMPGRAPLQSEREGRRGAGRQVARRPAATCSWCRAISRVRPRSRAWSRKPPAHFGRLDGLVNNAGGMLGRMAYADMTDEQYDAVMDLNGRSVHHRQPGRHPLSQATGRLHHQHLLDRGAQRRQRWRGALWLVQGASCRTSRAAWPRN